MYNMYCSYVVCCKVNIVTLLHQLVCCVLREQMPPVSIFCTISTKLCMYTFCACAGVCVCIELTPAIRRVTLDPWSILYLWHTLV